MKRNPKILFICKKRNDSYGISFGLLNSAQFVCNALIKKGVESKVVTVVDNNQIDREVSEYKPTHVVIEALWVVPEKFYQLLPLHKKVKWTVRIHSKTPFLANEGIAIEWLKAYNDISEQFKNFRVSANALSVINELSGSIHLNLDYLPNIYYPILKNEPFYKAKNKWVDIGCFGAVRPMKNHLHQAISAIIWANRNGHKLRFHVNGNRLEQKGEAVIRNLRSLFHDTTHKLIEHAWTPHADFIKLVKSMDMGMQISFSETFNIVAADFASNDIPIIGSSEIDWLSPMYKASTNDYDDVVNKLGFAWRMKNFNFHWLNKAGLEKYNKRAIDIWLDYLGVSR